MKKVISIVVVLVLVLSLGAAAYADSVLNITKNPTNENHTAGETAYFISGAARYESCTWTFVSPSGEKLSVQSFRNRFPYATVEGENTTTLTIRNLGLDMNNWGAFCTFKLADAAADTTTAYMFVSAYVPPTSNTAYYGNNYYNETYMFENADGDLTLYNTDGSFMLISPDGSWVSYDANTGAIDGGVVGF